MNTQNEMTIQEAFNVVFQACAEFKGTLKDHQIIQQALQKIKTELENKPEFEFIPADKE